ncbi:DeoR family transcriptional regulator [Halobacteriales archaeon QS_1_68_17]|nr:MAG: DeoR family transcriptional regulator [Halobacteriales archaeon QS_1_68_17]
MRGNDRGRSGGTAVTTPETRRRRIVELVTDRNGLSVDELIDEFDVSGSTIRRDLRALADRNLIERTHGGAMPATHARSERPFDQKVVEGLERKRAIGRRAAREIQQGQVVFFDSGTTTFQIAREAPTDGSFVSVTNSPLLAMELGKDDGIVKMTGGSFREESMGLVGRPAQSYVRTSNFDLAFVGTNGIDEKGALTSPIEEEAAVKTEVIASAAQTVIVADLTKFGERTFRQFATLEDVDAVITDGRVPDRFHDAFEAADTEWLEGVAE